MRRQSVAHGDPLGLSKGKLLLGRILILPCKRFFEIMKSQKKLLDRRRNKWYNTPCERAQHL